MQPCTGSCINGMSVCFYLRSTGSTASSAADAAKSTPLAELLHCAPAAVQLSYTLGPQDGPFKADTPPLTIIFQYLPALHIIAVQSGGEAAHAHLLTNLFPGDPGSVTPNLSNHFLLVRQNANTAAAVPFRYPAQAAARPYRWAQYLAGEQGCATSFDVTAQ